jgi:hypothetical protein
MNSFEILSAALIVMLALAIWFLRRRAVSAADQADQFDTVADWPPKATRVLTSAECLAYKTLVRALPGHMILAQVPLARFLKVPTRNSYTEWLRRLGSQCADMVVCDMASEVVAVVSVQAPVGETSERARKRHKRMARVLKAARIPLHVWTSNALPSAEVARDLLLPPQPATAATGAQARPPVAPAAPAAPPPSRPNPLDEVDRDSSHDERIEGMEPQPSTWFDEFNSGPTPLQPIKPRR